ncbi:MAG: hypothetical protein WBO06_04940, partial [Gammaproteobacteria bacterium]
MNRTSVNRTRLFHLVAFMLPLLFFLLLEAGLRLSGYGEARPLFVPAETDPADNASLMLNHDVARRYFPGDGFIPLPTSDRFLQRKPDNGYRVFVLGGSTAAGWPYPENVIFSRRLQQQLADVFPEKRIEVVSTGIAAVNTFTLLDLLDEILAQSPDAILIYAGHNEFYGAFGTASTITPGRMHWPVRLYLSLQELRLFMLLRDVVAMARDWARRDGGDSKRGTRTLMGQVIAEQWIDTDSELYARTEAQFRHNLLEILSRINAAGVPLLVSELVSNLRDHPPFFSDGEQTDSAASQAYRAARERETAADIAAARFGYYRAKDLDGLRFRAPESFNTIIHELASEMAIPVVPMKSWFEQASPNGLIGDSLMLEHLHPNAEGHLLMSRAFLEAMRTHGLVTDDWSTREVRDLEYYREHSTYSRMDTMIGHLRVMYLMDHWPYRPEGQPTRHALDYYPRNRMEALAKQVASGKLSYRDGHMQLAEYFLQQDMMDAALHEYRALINQSPLDPAHYTAVIRQLILVQALPEAQMFIEQAAVIAGFNEGRLTT